MATIRRRSALTGAEREGVHNYHDMMKAIPQVGQTATWEAF